MSVPKAAVNKNSFLETRNYQIRLARQILTMKSVSVSKPVNETPYS